MGTPGNINMSPVTGRTRRSTLGIGRPSSLLDRNGLSPGLVEQINFADILLYPERTAPTRQPLPPHQSPARVPRPHTDPTSDPPPSEAREEVVESAREARLCIREEALSVREEAIVESAREARLRIREEALSVREAHEAMVLASRHALVLSPADEALRLQQEACDHDLAQQLEHEQARLEQAQARIYEAQEAKVRDNQARAAQRLEQEKQARLAQRLEQENAVRATIAKLVAERERLEQAQLPASVPAPVIAPVPAPPAPPAPAPGPVPTPDIATIITNALLQQANFAAAERAAEKAAEKAEKLLKRLFRLPSYSNPELEE